jgi:hypothetical protein
VPVAHPIWGLPALLARTFHKNFSASTGLIKIKPLGPISGLNGRSANWSVGHRFLLVADDAEKFHEMSG